jgi:hypothetical protein
MELKHIFRLTIQSFNSKVRVFDSKILKSNWIKICDFPAGQQWQLLYRASVHGFSAHDFHSKCDNQKKTLSLIKTTNGFVFGGYTEQLWNHIGHFQTDYRAFIFSLANVDKKPVKMEIQVPEFAIYCDSGFGPTFGSGHDIHIAEYSHSNQKSYSELSETYLHPPYERGSNEANCFLAGSYNFQVTEIEVFKRL